MTIRTSIVQYCLKSSFKAVGINPTSAPQVFDAATYVRPTSRVDAVHVVVGPSTIIWYSYSQDPRESVTRTSYPNIESFIRAILKQRLQWACTVYIGSSDKTMEKLRTGKVDEYLAEQKRVETVLENRREAYIRSVTFSLLKLIA